MIYKSIKYLFFRYILRKEFLITDLNQYGSRLKFKIEDVVGRHIYKQGTYEKELSDFITTELDFKEGDIALDIGANIGWYSLLLDKLMPNNCEIFAFEPDPLNFQLFSFNIKLNRSKIITPINSALSDKVEIKKLYQYPNKNLGRHSLLDINGKEFVEVNTLVLDNYLEMEKIDFKKIKFMKIDIEGYEYIALLGADKVLDNVKYLISEFVPSHMKKGNMNPELLIDLLENKGFISHVIIKGKLCSIDKEEILSKKACDIIWTK